MHACTYVNVYVCLCAPEHACTHLCMHVDGCVPRHTYASAPLISSASAGGDLQQPATIHTGED